MTRITETGIILSVDYSLKDQLTGYIKSDSGEIMPYYHPKCEKFYPEPGRTCKFAIDIIKIDCIESINNEFEIKWPLNPGFLEWTNYVLSNEKISDSEKSSYSRMLTAVVMNSVGGAGKKVAVDLEDDKK